MTIRPLVEYIKKMGNVPEAVKQVVSKYNHRNASNSSRELNEPLCTHLEDPLYDKELKLD